MFTNIAVHYVWFGVLLAAIAFIVSSSIYPLVLRMARVWKVYDNPEARKLQREPVPVMGGVSVWCGIIASFCLLMTIYFNWKVVMMMCGMTVLMIVGVVDDSHKLGVRIRFVVEVALVAGMVWFSGAGIDNLGGIFGIGPLNQAITLALSVVAGVGIINAINLMDGVDGYSSLYAMTSCVFFAIAFYAGRAPGMGIVSLICAGSVLPFFLHNVFGHTTKMFIGDGGTLMLGTMFSILCFYLIRDDGICYHRLFLSKGAGMIPLSLAILSIPVFDTLRVMFGRILRGTSPFHPDKTHLHHIFIEMGFSHLGTTVVIVSFQCLIVLGWYVSWRLGADSTLQTAVVIALGLLSTVGFYNLMRGSLKRGGRLWRTFCAIGAHTHYEKHATFQWIQRLVDDRLFEEGYKEY